MSRCKVVAFLLTPILTLIPAVAGAHTGHGETAGFAQGFLHPLGGPDHALAMLAIGILAYQLGGRAFWMLPSVFVMVMAIGWALGVVACSSRTSKPVSPFPSSYSEAPFSLP
jgi:urease accessory protein